MKINSKCQFTQRDISVKLIFFLFLSLFLSVSWLTCVWLSLVFCVKELTKPKLETQFSITIV